MVTKNKAKCEKGDKQAKHLIWKGKQSHMTNMFAWCVYLLATVTTKV